jgi:hypothetical protein
MLTLLVFAFVYQVQS